MLCHLRVYFNSTQFTNTKVRAHSLQINVNGVYSCTSINESYANKNIGITRVVYILIEYLYIVIHRRLRQRSQHTNSLIIYKNGMGTNMRHCINIYVRIQV